MAVIPIHRTLVNVCAVFAVASEPGVTHAVVSTVEVGAGCISVTIIGINALIEI